MKRNLAVLFASAALLTACGDGSSDLAPVPAPTTPAPAPSTTTPPSVINDSVANFIGYILVLIGQNTDVAEALDVSAVVPPVGDTTEPMTLP